MNTIGVLLKSGVINMVTSQGRIIDLVQEIWKVLQLILMYNFRFYYKIIFHYILINPYINYNHNLIFKNKNCFV